MKKLTMGILAHVDAGKTTLSEAMLYQSGVIRKLGRVDYKDAYLDTYEMERILIILCQKSPCFVSCHNAFLLYLSDSFLRLYWIIGVSDFLVNPGSRMKEPVYSADQAEECSGRTSFRKDFFMVCYRKRQIYLPFSIALRGMRTIFAMLAGQK